MRKYNIIFLQKKHGHYFPHHPWHISTSWFVLINNFVIGIGDFLSYAALDYVSSYSAETCGFLVAPQSLDKLDSYHNPLICRLSRSDQEIKLISYSNKYGDQTLSNS